MIFLRHKGSDDLCLLFCLHPSSMLLPKLIFLCASQCLKLSPNLRRQSKEVKAALLNKDLKRAGEMEIKKLDQLLGQVGMEGDGD